MSSFKLDMSNIIKGLASAENKTKSALNLYGETVAKKMENYAKSNYSWTDRTHQASGRLQGARVVMGNKVRCSISHGVDYGIWLEVCNEQRYAILEPTIKAVGPEAVKGLNKIFK